MSNNNKSIQEFIKEYEDSPGHKLYDFLIKANCILYVFDDNYRELFNHITKYEKETASKQKNIKFKEVILSRVKNRNYLRRFVKYLHNYTASVYSLENHYRNFLFGDNGDGFDEEEWNNFARIKEKPLRLFIFGLRNYLTHYAIPPVSISVKYSKNRDGKTEFFVSTKGLFKLSKSAIISDYHKVQFGSNYKSKFLKNKRLLENLYWYVSREYRSTLSIDLKEVISNHHKLFHNHVDNSNSQLIRKYEPEYYKTKELHQNIVRMQNSLLKTKAIKSQRIRKTN